jgi:hypothetical protein
MRLIFSVLVLLSLPGCAAFTTIVGSLFGSKANEAYPPGNLYQYRGELLIKVDNVTFDGMAVTKLSVPIVVHIESKFPLDRIQFTSCGRQNVIRDFNNSWFSKTRTYDYTYYANRKEQEGKCPLYIEAFSKSALASWGFAAFRTDEALKGHLECNGESWTYAGYSVCQTKAGLDQSIWFEHKIKKFKADPGCHMVQVDDQHFDMRPDMGMCAATFFDGKDWHVMNMLGYSRVLVTGE